MKSVLYLTAAGLLLAVAASAQAQLQGIDPQTGQPAQPVVKPTVKVKPVPKPVAKAEPAGECTGDYGTTIQFEETPKDAATKAKKEEKLVFVLHVSGNFEDPRFT